MQKAKASRLAVLCTAVVLAVGVAIFYLGRPEPVVSTQFLMNTVVEQKLVGKNAKQAVAAVENELRLLENELSLFRSASAVSLVNQNAGQAPVPVGEPTFTLMTRAVEYGTASGGDFDITTAPLKQLWNVTGDMPHVPGQGEIDAILPLVDYRLLVLDPVARTVFLPQAGQEIDLGGVAKGYAADRCLAVLEEFDVTGYVSIGGNVAARGNGADGKPMRFGIRPPRECGAAYLGSVTVKDGVLATSGDYERYFEQDGVRYHHILDPKTGRPAQSGLISVSVLCADGAQADFLSTALFVRGRDGLDSLKERYDYEYIAVDQNCNVIVSDGLREQFALNPDAEGYRMIL